MSAKRKTLIQVVVITLILGSIPAFFAGMMVWAMQDPLHRLFHVPAAVVNQDKEVKLDTGDDTTTTLNLGQEIVDNIFDNHDSDNFAWTETDADTAARGLADGRFYVVLTIPESFSADATSAVSAEPDHPRRASLLVTTNDALNYLTGTIAQGMGNTVAATVNEKVAAEFAEHIYVHFNDIQDNLSDAATNSAKLVDGAERASDGAGHLLGGLAQLRDKTAALPAKMGKLGTGTDKALTGARKLYSGSKKLLTGARAMADGTATAAANGAKLSGGATTLAGNLSSMAHGMSSLSDGLDGLLKGYDSMPDAQREDVLRQLAGAASGLATGASKAAAGAQGLMTGAGQLDSGLSMMAGGAGNLLAGAQSLNTGARHELDGISKLKTGVTKMAHNIPKLVTGSQKAYEGGVKLNDGLQNMVHGTRKMHDGLSDGADGMPTFTQAQVDSLPDYVSEATLLDKQATNSLPSFGGALAPFFLSIALWIGCLALFMMRPSVSGKAAEPGSPLATAYVRSLLFPAGVAILQGLVAVWAVHSLVGIQTADLATLAGLAALVSLTFMAINQALVALVGPPGRFLVILLLICQVAAAGGIFPIQTAPAFVQQLADWLPLGRAVQAFKSAIAGGSLGVGDAVSMLVAWLVAALAFTFLGVLKTRRSAAVAAARAQA